MHMYLIIILLQFYTVLAIITNNYLPKFESLPPPLVYYSDNDGDSQKKLSCKAWPEGSEITLFSTMRMSDSNSNNPSQSQFLKSAPLYPLDSQDIENGNLMLRNINQVRRLSKLDLHCLAKTDFGAVISRPFRVVEAKMGNFPSGNSGTAYKVIKNFMYGNVAYVDCLPPESFPPAKIEFTLNTTIIQLTKRYRYIKRPNSRKVILLITAFEPRDQGDYRCTATNPITGEQKTDPIIQQLKIKNPMQKLSSYIKMSISGKELSSGISLNPSQTLFIREGSNVTLFCVMEGVPPPYVNVYKSRTFNTVNNNLYRHISDRDMGFLTLYNVSSEDEDSYLCSDNIVTDTIQLKVQKPLSIIQGPQAIRVNALGSEARFTCLSSDKDITPQWYFNGKLRKQSLQSGKDSSLHIINVRKEDLGVYQCVARSQDEWVTHIATLSLKNEQLFINNNNGVEDVSKGNPLPKFQEPRGSRIKKNAIVQYRSTSKRPLNIIRDELEPPSVQVIGDNLAVLLKWHKPSGIIKHYKLQYRFRQVDSDSWSHINTLENEITEPFFYVTSTHILAQHVYQFKIVAVHIDSSSMPGSQWSREVSFAHVYPVHPIVQQIKPSNSTHVLICWAYIHSDIYPISRYDILIRSVIQQGQKLIYSRYSAINVRNANATELLLGPLSPGEHYQALIYGIREGALRKITRYSPEVTFDSPNTLTTVWGLKNNSESNTRLMFIILGSLAGLMMLVIIVLVFMCYCRERKSIVRLNRYKDPAKLIHSDPSKAAHSSFLLASISATANNHTQPKHIPDGSMERASLLGNHDQVYCQQKRQPPSGGSGHDVSEEASIHEMSAAQDIGNSIPHHMLGQAGMMTPQPPAVTYYKIATGPASLPAGSLLRQNNNSLQHQNPQYCPQYAPIPQQVYYTGNTGYVYPQQCGGYIGSSMMPQQQIMVNNNSNVSGGISGQGGGGGGGSQVKQEFSDMRSQDGGESVYSYFSQTSNAAAQRHDLHAGTVEAGSQTINSNGTGSASHRHHRRKRRKTNHSGVNLSENSDNCSPQPVQMIPRMGYTGEPQHMLGREVMYDTPPSGHDPRIMMAPPGMVLVQSGISSHPDQNWVHLNNTLTRRGTPTLFVEPPRIRDYSEYGIPPNQMVPIQPQQLAHLSQQNLHLHNQNLSGYRDAQA